MLCLTPIRARNLAEERGWHPAVRQETNRWTARVLQANRHGQARLRGQMNVAGMVIVAFAVTLAYAPSAAADTLPPQECEHSQVGTACDNAGTGANEHGACQPSTCSTAVYKCEAGHVGPCGTEKVACILCVAGGSGGSATKGSKAVAADVGAQAGVASDGAPVAGGASSKASGGCAASSFGPSSGGWAAFLSLAAVAAASRRRRPPQTRSHRILSPSWPRTKPGV
jgi:uncharacterized protein (TIGR03382 family)